MCNEYWNILWIYLEQGGETLCLLWWKEEIINEERGESDEELVSYGDEYWRKFNG